MRKLERYLTPFTLLLVVASLLVASYSLSQQGNSAYAACKIQQKGLAANEQLQRFFIDYDELLGIDTKTRVGRAQLAKLPPRQRHLTLDAITAIHAYSTLVKAQPRHRTCP